MLSSSMPLSKGKSKEVYIKLYVMSGHIRSYSLNLIFSTSNKFSSKIHAPQNISATFSCDTQVIGNYSF